MANPQFKAWQLTALVSLSLIAASCGKKRDNPDSGKQATLDIDLSENPKLLEDFQELEILVKSEAASEFTSFKFARGATGFTGVGFNLNEGHYRIAAKIYRRPGDTVPYAQSIDGREECDYLSLDLTSEQISKATLSLCIPDAVTFEVPDEDLDFGFDIVGYEAAMICEEVFLQRAEAASDDDELLTRYQSMSVRYKASDSGYSYMLYMVSDQPEKVPLSFLLANGENLIQFKGEVVSGFTQNIQADWGEQPGILFQAQSNLFYSGRSCSKAVQSLDSIGL